MTNETRYPNLTIENIAKAAPNREPESKYDHTGNPEDNMTYVVAVFVTESGECYPYARMANDWGETFYCYVDAVEVLEELGHPAPKMEDFGYDENAKEYFDEDKYEWVYPEWDERGYEDALCSYMQLIYDYESIECAWYKDACCNLLDQAQKWLKSINDEGE